MANNDRRGGSALRHWLAMTMRPYRASGRPVSSNIDSAQLEVTPLQLVAALQALELENGVNPLRPGRATDVQLLAARVMKQTASATLTRPRVKESGLTLEKSAQFVKAEQSYRATVAADTRVILRFDSVTHRLASAEHVSSAITANVRTWTTDVHGVPLARVVVARAAPVVGLPPGVVLAAVTTQPRFSLGDRFGGLGIGTRLYKALAAADSNTRWGSTPPVSASAVALRRKLHHQSAAYFWESGGYSWCAAHGIVFTAATRADYAHHP